MLKVPIQINQKDLFSEDLFFQGAVVIYVLLFVFTFSCLFLGYLGIIHPSRNASKGREGTLTYDAIFQFIWRAIVRTATKAEGGLKNDKFCIT